MGAEEAMALMCIQQGRVEGIELYYIPSRRATAKHGVPLPTLGLGNVFCFCGKCYHFLFVDVDNKNNLRIIEEYAYANFPDHPWVIRETRKGLHLMVFGLFRKREVDHHVSRLKPFVDRKWLTMSRKRGFYVLRVAGKYWPPDIRNIRLHLTVNDEDRMRLGATFIMWLEVLKWTPPEEIAGRLVELNPRVLSSRYVHKPGLMEVLRSA